MVLCRSCGNLFPSSLLVSICCSLTHRLLLKSCRLYYIGLQDLGAATQSASDATEVADTSLQQLTDAELDEVLRVTDPSMTAHEVQGGPQDC